MFAVLGTKRGKGITNSLPIFAHKDDSKAWIVVQQALFAPLGWGNLVGLLWAEGGEEAAEGAEDAGIGE